MQTKNETEQAYGQNCTKTPPPHSVSSLQQAKTKNHTRAVPELH